MTAPTSSRTKDGGGRPAWFSTSAIFNTKAATDVSRVDLVVIRRELSPGKVISPLGATLRINQGLEGGGGEVAFARSLRRPVRDENSQAISDSYTQSLQLASIRDNIDPCGVKELIDFPGLQCCLIDTNQLYSLR